MKVRVKLDEGAFMPEKAHDMDAGFDIRTPEDKFLVLGWPIVIDTGVHVEIPRGYVGMLKSKSGLYINNCIRCEGVIDAGYTGSIKAKMYLDDSELSKPRYFFEKGDKICQLVILPIPEIELELVEEIEGGERGSKGFGSTGR